MPPHDLRLAQPLLGRRDVARLRVEQKARLVTLDGSLGAVLADIGRHGARLLVPDCGLRPGHEVVLSWDRFEAFGDVIWSAEDQIGLRFDAPLAQAVLLATRAAEDARVMPVQRQLLREAAQTFVDPRSASGRFGRRTMKI